MVRSSRGPAAICGLWAAMFVARSHSGNRRGTSTYTWNVFGPGEEQSPYPESYLTIELEPHGNEVLLTLIHLPVLERFEKQNAMGWHTYLDMAEAGLRGQSPEAREVHMKRNAVRYGVDLAKLAR